MKVSSNKYKDVSYKYERQNGILYIYKEDIAIIQLRFDFDERFTEKTLQYFGDMLYEPMHDRIVFAEAVSQVFIENALFDYDESEMWRKW